MRKPIQSKTPYVVPSVTQQAVKAGVCKDPFACVLAQHILDTDKNVLVAEVQKSRTTLTYNDGRVVDQATPLSVKKAIDHFDETTEWILPEGPITFGAIPPSQTRKAIRDRARRIAKDVKRGLRTAPRTNYAGTGTRTPSVRQALLGRRRASLSQLQSAV